MRQRTLLALIRPNAASIGIGFVPNAVKCDMAFLSVEPYVLKRPKASQNETKSSQKSVSFKLDQHLLRQSLFGQIHKGRGIQSHGHDEAIEKNNVRKNQVNFFVSHIWVSESKR
jgi:hypothetical protein